MRSVFFFDSMLTPKIITFVYWLLLLIAIVSGVAAMMNQYDGFLMGLAIIVFGAIGARLWCELMIVLFKINENVQKMANKSE